MPRNRITIICETCDQPFEVEPHRLKTARFCSRSCHAQAPKPGKRVPAEKRFWANVQRTDDLFSCWPWTGATDTHGYGHFSLGKRLVLSHRYSWELHHGPIPEGQCVLHTCDNPPCCRPDHLWLGTKADNVDDMITKGRKVLLQGEAHHATRLTEEQVLEIRARYAAGGVTGTGLAREYGVRHRVIYCILWRHTWKHI